MNALELPRPAVPVTNCISFFATETPSALVGQLSSPNARLCVVSKPLILLIPSNNYCKSSGAAPKEGIDLELNRPPEASWRLSGPVTQLA